MNKTVMCSSVKSVCNFSTDRWVSNFYEIMDSNILCQKLAKSGFCSTEVFSLQLKLDVSRNESMPSLLFKHVTRCAA